MGPNLGAEMPSLDMPEQEPSAFARSRSQILPQPGDFEDAKKVSPWAPRLMDDDSLIQQDPMFSLGITKTRQPYNLGVDLNRQDEPEAQPTAMPEGTPMPDLPAMPKLSELDMSPEATNDPQRRRGLYTALAQFSAGMGNIGGNPTETTVPGYFKDLTQQEGFQQENLLKQAQARRTGIESEYKIKEAQYQAQLRQRMKDPNSRESMVARDAINSYAKKYGIAEVPPTATAEDLERQMPMLRDIIRGETSKVNKLDEIGLTTRLAAEEKDRQRQWEERQKEAGASQQLRLLDKQFTNQMALRERELAAQKEANELIRQGRFEEARAKEQDAEKARKAQREFQAWQTQENQKFQAGQAQQNRNFQAGQKQADREADVDKEQRKLEEENKELTVPGYELTGQVRPTGKEAADLRSGIATRDSFLQKLKSYRDLIEKYGTYENTITSAAGDKMATLATQMHLDLKNIAELGALSGPDMGLMIQLLPEPNAWTSAFKSKAGLMQKLGQLQKEAITRINNQLLSKGYRPAGSAAPQGAQPPAAPSGRRVVRP
jgi:hypothetical protein